VQFQAKALGGRGGLRMLKPRAWPGVLGHSTQSISTKNRTVDFHLALFPPWVAFGTHARWLVGTRHILEL
jgi:hypothetical protein